MVHDGDALQLGAGHAHACAYPRAIAVGVLVDVHDEDLRQLAHSSLLFCIHATTRFTLEPVQVAHSQSVID